MSRTSPATQRITVSFRNRLIALIRKSGYQVRSVSFESVVRSTRMAMLKRISVVHPIATGLVGLHELIPISGRLGLG